MRENKRANFEEVGYLAKGKIFVTCLRGEREQKHQFQHFGVKLCPRNLTIWQDLL